MSNEYTQSEYETDVQELAESILSEVIEENPEADPLEVLEVIDERLHESVDSHQSVIYTWRAQLVLAHSDNDGYAAEHFGAESATDEDGNLNWSGLAYGAMYADTREVLMGLFNDWETIHNVAAEILDELDPDHEQSAAITVAIKRLGLMDEDEEREIWEEVNRLRVSKIRGQFLRVSQGQIVKVFEDRGFDCDTMGDSLPRAGYYLKANEGDQVADLFRTSATAPDMDWLAVNVSGPYATILEYIECDDECAEVEA